MAWHLMGDKPLHEPMLTKSYDTIWYNYATVLWFWDFYTHVIDSEIFN